MTKKKSNKSEKLKGFSDPPEIKEVEPEEQTGTYAYENKGLCVEEDKPLFVPDDEKIERIKEGLRQERIAKDKQLVDYWLRHELQLGTVSIKKMWKKMDEIYRK